MYIYIIFNPNQEKKPQGNKVVQYFKNLNSVGSLDNIKPDLLEANSFEFNGNQGLLL